MLAARKAHAQQMRELAPILMISAWGFVMVIAPFLFLYVGMLLDGVLGTSPHFMFGLFLLALVCTIGRLYQEAWRRRKAL